MRVLLLLFGALVAGVAAWREGEPVRLGVYTVDFPYAWVEDGEITGMEPALARAVCAHASLECELVPITLLEDRIPMLQNGSVDALFAGLAVTPKRAELVDFLHPFFDPSDVSLVVLEEGAEALEAAGTFKGIRGKKVCLQAGAAAIQHMPKLGAVVVEAVVRADVVDKLVAGECVAAVDGSYGLQLSQLAGERHNVTLIALPATEAVVPVAVGAAVPKGQAGSELGLRLTGGLVAAMSRGNESDVLRLQEEFLVPNGIPASAAVQTLVDSLTYLV